MNKSKLDGFITRYNLSGEVESVKISADSAGMYVSFISDDKTLLGNVTSNEPDFPAGEFGIYTTSQLKSMLTVLDSDIKVRHSDSTIKLSDSNTAVTYVLSDMAVIPDVPEMKQIPDFEADIKLDIDFITRFIKSKAALPDSDKFTFSYSADSGEIILGYSTLNTNRVSMVVKCTSSGDMKPIQFSADYLKSILVANKNSESASMKISSKGLCHLTFATADYTSEYYLVKLA